MPNEVDPADLIDAGWDDGHHAALEEILGHHENMVARYREGMNFHRREVRRIKARLDLLERKKKNA